MLHKIYATRVQASPSPQNIKNVYIVNGSYENRHHDTTLFGGLATHAPIHALLPKWFNCARPQLPRTQEKYGKVRKKHEVKRPSVNAS